MLSEVPEGWEETTFGKQIDFKGGNQPPKALSSISPLMAISATSDKRL